MIAKLVIALLAWRILRRLAVAAIIVALGLALLRTTSSHRAGATGGHSGIKHSILSIEHTVQRSIRRGTSP